ncbi:Eukaryotic aspartyl protease family protein [Rhynchospora pubera]|uniref:Eukaryotic aspartyl protease family protein n=1 Tax=Rhynchospora pubera TaxID=906938 RepID=A0AAV8EDI1_9POAL|nr:Eukaryotic aspartyl protease family protein [Rhynchospora pubera]
MWFSLSFLIVLITSSFTSTFSTPHSYADILLSQSLRGKSRLSSRATTGRSFVPIAPGRQLLQITNYIIRAQIGTPPQSLLLAIDTSNDAAWIPCTACVGCPSNSPSFTPSRSTSFRTVSCGSSQCSQVLNPLCPTGQTSCAFNMTYGSSSLQAGLVQDSFTLASDVVTSYTFGCLRQVSGNSVPPQGLLGLGRGPLSFLSQTKPLYGSVFSYCLPSFRSVNFTGTLRLGPKGQPQKIKTTPLLTNPRRPSLYYVNMVEIRVGSHVLPIPASAFTFDPNTGGGTIIDAGTMFTMLVGPAYTAVRDEFRRRVRVPIASPLGGFDTCYNTTITAPTISFIFGGGITVTLPQENILIHSSFGSITCLAMAASPATGVNSVLNVIASMQQQNHRVLFDIPNSRVGFAREPCTA